MVPIGTVSRESNYFLSKVFFRGSVSQENIVYQKWYLEGQSHEKVIIFYLKWFFRGSVSRENIVYQKWYLEGQS